VRKNLSNEEWAADNGSVSVWEKAAIKDDINARGGRQRNWLWGGRRT